VFYKPETRQGMLQDPVRWNPERADSLALAPYEIIRALAEDPEIYGASELNSGGALIKSNKIGALRRLILVAGAGFEPATFGL
jgi:hypothetical protein